MTSLASPLPIGTPPGAFSFHFHPRFGFSAARKKRAKSATNVDTDKMHHQTQGSGVLQLTRNNKVPSFVKKCFSLCIRASEILKSILWRRDFVEAALGKSFVSLSGLSV